MSTFKIEVVTHWSIPVNNLKESEDFYGGLARAHCGGAPDQQRDVLLQCRRS